MQTGKPNLVLIFSGHYPANRITHLASRFRISSFWSITGSPVSDIRQAGFKGLLNCSSSSSFRQTGSHSLSKNGFFLHSFSFQKSIILIHFQSKLIHINYFHSFLCLKSSLKSIFIIKLTSSLLYLYLDIPTFHLLFYFFFYFVFWIIWMFAMIFFSLTLRT